MTELIKLHSIDTVEVLTLASWGSSSLGSRLKTMSEVFPILMSTLVNDSLIVGAIVDLWHNLPEYEQVRCHFPPYGLRFISQESIVLEVSICWKCNNIWTISPEKRGVYNFDGSSEPAQKFLNLLRYLSGDYFTYSSNSSLSINDYI